MKKPPSSSQESPDLAPVLEVLRSVARRHMADQGRQVTLQTTVLINEAWLKLRDLRPDRWEDERSFRALVARTVRSILIDHARARSAQKRTGPDGVAIDLQELSDRSLNGVALLELNETLERLEELDSEAARVVELRIFADLSHPEIAAEMDCSLRTVERRWAMARAWLGKELGRSDSR